jgi:hypothetical protein
MGAFEINFTLVLILAAGAVMLGLMASVFSGPGKMMATIGAAGFISIALLYVVLSAIGGFASFMNNLPY